MSIEIKVPSIACGGCGENITQAIKNAQPEAIVNVDVDNKLVKVETSSSLEAIKQIIVDIGHTPE